MTQVSPPKRLSFEPAFRALLVQMIQQGQTEAAARLAAREAIAAFAARNKTGAPTEPATDHGLELEMRVPAKHRLRELEEEQEKENDRGMSL